MDYSLENRDSSSDDESYELIENLTTSFARSDETPADSSSQPELRRRDDKKPEEYKLQNTSADPIRCDRTVTLSRGDNESLGFTVLDGSVTDVGDKALFQGLRPGDRIISIDGVNVEMETHEVVMNLLVGPFSGRHTVTLVVRYDPVRVVEELDPKPGTTRVKNLRCGLTDEEYWSEGKEEASPDSEKTEETTIEDEMERIREIIDIAAKRIERKKEQLRIERVLVKAKDMAIELLKRKNEEYERRIEAMESEQKKEIKRRDEEIARLMDALNSVEQSRVNATGKMKKSSTWNNLMSETKEKKIFEILEKELHKKRQEKEEEQRKQALTKAKKAVDDAKNELKSIRKVTSIEVNSSGNPPEAIAKTLDAVRLLLADDKIVSYYQGLRAVVLSIDFIPRILSFNTESITAATLEQMQQFTLDPALSYDKLNCLSPNCGSIIKWVKAQIHCAELMQRTSDGYRRKQASALDQTKVKATEIRRKMDEAMGIVNGQIEDDKVDQEMLKDALFNDPLAVNDYTCLVNALCRSRDEIRRGYVSKVQILGVLLAMNDAIEMMEKTGEMKASKGIAKSMRCLVKATGIETLMREVSDGMIEIGLIGDVDEDDFNVEANNDDEERTFDHGINQVYEIIKNELSKLKNEMLKYF